ncbi:MAG: hypothetical protein M3139_16090 [Bacteroidota bacterium]|nr:hypothetical protein [Bacteroidota bacterium]
MAINKNHLFEELDGIKCGIVEKDVSPDRVVFLKKLLEYNGFTVITVLSPPPKAAPEPVLKSDDGTIIPPPLPPAAPETFTVGVTDYTFNPINAIFGRLLHTQDGHVVSLAYWEQKEVVSHDEVPYFDKE